jgi:hypothetical protein
MSVPSRCDGRKVQRIFIEIEQRFFSRVFLSLGIAQFAIVKVNVLENSCTIFTVQFFTIGFFQSAKAMSITHQYSLRSCGRKNLKWLCSGTTKRSCCMARLARSVSPLYFLSNLPFYHRAHH